LSLTDNLVAYYKLDEASGNALDSTPNGYDLTENGTVASVAGKVGNARDFEADSNNFFSRADNADLSTGDVDFTIAAWVKIESKGAHRFIVSKEDGSNGEYRLSYNSGDDTFTFSAYGASGFGSGNGVNAATLGSPSTAVWYYIIAWHDSAANTLNISVNDGAVDSISFSGGVYDGAGVFRIGGNAFSQYFDGVIDEVGFWKRKLTEEERTALYNSGNGLSYDDFDEEEPEPATYLDEEGLLYNIVTVW
jgi:hypothetical protein